MFLMQSFYLQYILQMKDKKINTNYIFFNHDNPKLFLFT